MQMSALGGISVNLPWIGFEKRNKWQGWRLNMDRQAGSIKPRWCSQISHSFPLNPNIFSWFFKNILPIEPYVCPTIGASDPSALTEILNTCFFFLQVPVKRCCHVNVDTMQSEASLSCLLCPQSKSEDIFIRRILFHCFTDRFICRRQCLLFVLLWRCLKQVLIYSSLQTSPRCSLRVSTQWHN